MESSKTNLMISKVDVDETCVGSQDDSSIDRKEGKKRIMVVAVERKGKWVSKVYGKVIKIASRKNLQNFIQEHICNKAEIRTEGWKGYLGLEEEFCNLAKEKSGKKGENFP